MANEFVIQQGIIVGHASGAAITVVPTTDDISTITFDDGSGGQISEIKFDHGTDTFTLDIGGITKIQATSTGVTIGGDFDVSGTTTTSSAVNLVITDNIILLNDGEAGAGVGNGTGNAGIEIDRGTLDNAGWYYNESQNWWGPTGPSGTFGPGIGATQSIGNIAVIDSTDATEQVLTISSSGSMILPSGTTAQRPATPSAGMSRWNTTLTTLEVYDGTGWSKILATAPGSPLVITGDIDLSNTYKIISPLNPTDATGVGDRGYNDSRYLQLANNLSDIPNPAQARINLGLNASSVDAVARAGDDMYGSLVMGDGGTVEVQASTIAVAGTLYSVDDVLTIIGGTFTTALTIKVNTVGGGGEILTFEQEGKGVYTAAPSSPASVTGGTGSGATFNLTTSVPDVDIMPYEDYATPGANPRDIGKTNGEDGWVNPDQRFRSIHAETFYGTATAALYADLAERYEADAEYNEGTVVIFGGEKEITITEMIGDTRVAGVISIYPAFKMNSGVGQSDTHPYVALKGKVPCKVIGTVKKGELLVTSKIPGHAMSSGDTAEPYTAFARALENFTGKNGIIFVSII